MKKCRNPVISLANTSIRHSDMIALFPGNQGNQGKSGKEEKGWNTQGKVREFEKKIGNSGNLNSLSKRKSFVIPSVQSNDLSFYQNVISRSQGRWKSRKVATL